MIQAGNETYEAVTTALKLGYRSIDCAEWYENEEECGRAIRDFCQQNNVPRQEIYYTTKLMLNADIAHARVAIRESLRKSGLEYIDLYLVHGPHPGKEERLASWKACEEAKEEGIVKSIGVSNYGNHHLQEIFDSNPKYMPVINQLALNPFMTHSDLVQFNKEHKIVLEAWAPLARGEKMDHETLVTLARKHNKSTAQILIRYSLQKDFVCIPKSVKKERMIENLNVFDFALSVDEMAELDALDCYLVQDWDPTKDP
jgi:diketogulonate reductase-like aldo/keto reductase